MLLKEQIIDSLPGLKGFASQVPTTVAWASDGATVEVDFTAVETLGCAFRELRVVAAELREKSFESLKAWAEQICKKVNYLLEPIGPLELDSDSQQILVRSSAPAKTGEQTAYYEMRIAAPGSLCLRRYLRDERNAEAQPCDIAVTQEVLLRLVDDILAAIPAPEGE